MIPRYEGTKPAAGTSGLNCCVGMGGGKVGHGEGDGGNDRRVIGEIQRKSIEGDNWEGNVGGHGDGDGEGDAGDSP